MIRKKTIKLTISIYKELISHYELLHGTTLFRSPTRFERADYKKYEECKIALAEFETSEKEYK